MRPLIAGVMVPVAIEEMSPNLRLDLAIGLSLVAVGVALIAVREVGRRDWRTVGIHSRREDDGFRIRRPLGVISLRRNRGQLARVCCRTGRRIEVRQPYLLATLPPG